NVCGGQQCCSGWALAPGTNRCIKPDCQPPCQNRGSCSRPHTCVCRSGFQGPRCEEVTPEQVFGSQLANPAVRTCREAADGEKKNSEICLTLLFSLSVSTPPPSSDPNYKVSYFWPALQQQTGTSRTVKRYPSSSAPITSNALPSNNGFTNSRSSVQNCNALSPAGANLTASLDRIKIVFTPMRCRRVCSGNRCYNSCEKGDVTTVYSETSQQQPPKTQGFRLFFCQIPCLNGGKCIGRDQCWCPSNATGKFCHLPAPVPTKPTTQGHKDAGPQGQKPHSHSMYTLPLSNQQVSLHPSLVNVHIQHPPEAEVQIHQVARVQPGQRPVITEESATEQGSRHPHTSHTSHTSHDGRNGHNGHGSLRPHYPQSEHVGRCFQETVDGQCGKPLPGLTKQDDCCGSIGASWGLNKCHKCPTKPAYAVISNGQVECSKGFKRLNLTHCQDINECLLPGICKNAECLNTKGSYRCLCKVGYMLDLESKNCVSDKAVSHQKALCYRSVSAETCSLPLTQHITKQICCCSRVGKAWGAGCDRCPLPGSDHFKEICPAGHGYTYSLSDVQISVRRLGEDGVQSTGLSWEEQSRLYPQIPSSHPSLPFGPQYPSYPQTPQIPQYPEYLETPQVPQDPLAPQHPLYPFYPDREPLEQPQGENEKWHDGKSLPGNPAVVTDSPLNYPGINKCALTPTICGRGECVPLQTGYTCQCEPGFKLSALQTNCIDVNECDTDPCEGKGRCINSYGSYTCHCHSGYSQVITQNRRFCQGEPPDINECSMPNKCQNGKCVNTEGSYTCECNSGFAKSWRGLCEADVDECRDPRSCPNGVCVNTAGSYQCQLCSPGFRPADDRCVDVDECLLPGVCLHGRCINLEGSYKCTCNHGYQVTPDSRSCEDIDECALPTTCPRGTCTNTEGSFTCITCQPGFMVSEDGQQCEDIDECQTPGACFAGVCTNTEGSFSCTACDPGFTAAPDGHSCKGADVNECEDSSLCLRGWCINTVGSFSCSCPSGMELVDETTCQPVRQCEIQWDSVEKGDCLNTEGSYMCVCPKGYVDINGRTGCQDVDECSKDNVCRRGQCLNTDGSFLCLCEAGFKYSDETADCEDQNECEDFGSAVCGTWRCKNTIGSYLCFMGCQSGLQGEDNTDCGDIDECANDTICGNHGFCENTNGSFLCHCDQGYTNPPGDTSRCVDVNECEMSMALCGEALCENFDGSFLCICPNDNEEFDSSTSQCLSPANTTSKTPTQAPPSGPLQEERKECYYNLNDANFCDNVLSRNTTKQECCCTVGAGWGDNCEIHACPIPGRDDFNKLCPHGSGLLPLTVSSVGNHWAYIDANECEMFGSEICKNGQCSNLFSTYTCYCHSGFYYDNIRLECVDYDECAFGTACENGVCMNTAGSFNCFCSPPLVLDSTRHHCVSLNTTEESFQNVHVDICWKRLEEDNMCSSPHQEERTTYAECCCLHGVAWSEQCALCPKGDSKDLAGLCNLPWRGSSDSLREQPGYEYGLEGAEDHEDTFLPPYFANYGNPAESYDIPESVPLFTDNDYSVQQPPARIPIIRPREQSPHRVDPHTRRYDSFEGLRAEECGILNGCENGRCVRVREGYTCDCFDGYEFNLKKMACV
uniref:Latent-transforming growth factor beta-binding protein 1 n=1 Tax=Tetraodon nigroviridis TaxID=99883 RepID=H3DJ72_TETNG